MKLHLGCGNDKLVGYINCDISENVNPDLILDLEKSLPFNNFTIDEILANHVLEHINKFIPLMHEFWRISKKDSKLIFRTPFYSYWGQFNDPTHVRFFTPWTFNYFQNGPLSHEVNTDKDMFIVEKVKLNFFVGKLKKINWLINPIINLNLKIYCRFFAWIFPAAEIYYELKVIK